MARTQFTFTFTNAQPGSVVSFDNIDAEHLYASATGSGRLGHPLVLDSSNSLSVWSDASQLTARTEDGAGNDISATATVAVPTVTSADGTAGHNPFGSGGSSAGLATPLLAWGSGYDFGMDIGAPVVIDHTVPFPVIPMQYGYANDGVTAGTAPIDNAYMTWAGSGATHLTLKKDGWYLVQYEITLAEPAPVTIEFGLDDSPAQQMFRDDNIPAGSMRVQGNFMNYYRGLPGSGGDLCLHTFLDADLTINVAVLGFTPLFDAYS